MLGKIMAILAVASCVVAGIGPAAAGGKAARAASENSPWFQTDSGFTLSRANHTEHVLTPATVARARFLRGVVSPPIPPQEQCLGGTASPVLVGGYLYLITDFRVSKYNAATGKLIWRRTPAPTVVTYYVSLSVSGNGLLVVDSAHCDSNSDIIGVLYAYNAATGKLVWSAGDEGLQQAVVANGYVVTSGSDGSGDYFAVLNLSDGKTVWDWATECGPVTSPVVIDSLTFVGNCDSNTLEARHLGTGTLAWSAPDIDAIQRGDANELFATDSAGAVVALNPLTGQQEYTLSQAVTVLAADTSRAYATCGSQGQDLCAYNLSTGTLEWQEAFTTALAAEAGGVLYLDSGDALNAATGKFIKTMPFVSPPASALAVGDGRIAAVTAPRILDLYGLSGY
jgi:outer membrane protein assembly factor BamB